MTTRNTRILVLSSESSSCSNLKDTISHLDFQVDCCTDVNTALKLQMEEPRDMVIAEYEFENTSAVEFLKHILTSGHTSTRVLVGDKANEEQIIKAIVKGVACTYLDKSLSREKIAVKLEDISRVRGSMNNPKLMSLLDQGNSLPISMVVYEQFMEAVNEDKSIPEISEIISKDITLTAKVLKVANSAFYGNFNSNSVEKAIIYMGLITVKDIVLLHSLSANLNMTAAQNEELEDIVRHSIITNYYMHAIAKKSGNCPITPINNSIGIVHDIGKLVQLVFFPLEFNNIVEFRQENRNTDYYTCETATGNAGIKHSEIGAYFLQCWNFNQYSIEAALFHHEPENASEVAKPYVEAIFLANTIADIRDGYNLSLKDALARCTEIDLDADDILTILPPI